MSRSSGVGRRLARSVVRSAVGVLVLAPLLVVTANAATRQVPVEVAFIDPASVWESTSDVGAQHPQPVDGLTVITVDARGVVTDDANGEAAFRLVMQAPRLQPMAILVEDGASATSAAHADQSITVAFH